MIRMRMDIPATAGTADLRDCDSLNGFRLTRNVDLQCDSMLMWCLPSAPKRVLR